MGIQATARTGSICALDAELRQQVRDWLVDWQSAHLLERIDIRFSKQLRRSLGRCQPDTGRIRIAHWLTQAPREVLQEVVCHEVAHAAAHARYGRCRPHGSEWQSLMQKAGFEPRLRLPDSALPEALRHYTESRLPWEHRCPSCNASRAGRRAMQSWRCSRCIREGQDGRLVITRKTSS